MDGCFDKTSCSLVNRRKEGAMITSENEAVERTVRMVKEHRVRAMDDCGIYDLGA